jgi:glycerol-3-phosphate dehydrogenase (NAD(P)+)
MVDVAIVGAGLMGTATAYPLRDNGHRVRLVGTHLDGDIIRRCKEDGYHPRLKRKIPEGVHPYYVEEIGEALEGVQVIVSGVNSLGAHWIGKALAPHIRPGQTVIAITKGLEASADGDLLILPDVLRSELPEGVRDQVGYAAVGGPCIAGELAGRRSSCVVFGSRQQETAEMLASVFRTAYYHIWTTTELVGLEICAALKNAYTLAVGLSAGILESRGGVDPAGAYMHNLAAATFAQSVTEIGRVLEVAGRPRDFAASLPGAGDMYVTSAGGRTIGLGRLLGLGHSYSEARQIMAGETLEGAEIVRVMNAMLPRLEARGKLMPDELPLMRKLIDIIVHGGKPELPLEAFFGGRGWM